MLQRPDQVRAGVMDFEPYSPGLSIEEIRERFGLDRVIKLASNENPLGVSPLVREAIQRHAGQVFRYAQSGNPRLVKAVADFHGVGTEHVVLGNGSDEVIDLLIRCRAEPGVHNVVVSKPCFSIYPLQTRLCGVEMRQRPLREDFSFDWAGLLNMMDENTALVFLTTPDNPSGYCPAAHEVKAFAECLPAGALLVLDEAYMDFCDDGLSGEEVFSLLKNGQLPRNIAFLRTFSKSFGLAGLRLGYGIMPDTLADYLRRVRLPFSVNSLAEAAGLAALEDMDFYRASLEAVRLGRDELYKGLAGLGCRVHPSRANFLMLRPPEQSSLSAGQIFEGLLSLGIIIRPLRSYGLPGHLRVSVGDARDNKMLLRGMKSLLEGK